jgi:protein transport protein YIF1
VAPTPDHRIPPVAYHLPLHDDCAPDLYLPLMAGITYVLLSALLYGTAGKFNPEVIPDVCTKCFLTQILEVLALWLGFYMMRAATNIAVLDLFCYTGYKYQGLCMNMLVGLLLSHLGINGTRAYYVMFLYTGSAAFYFMLKTTANAIPLQLPHGTPPREMMVLAFGASQFATMWLVGQTKFL